MDMVEKVARAIYEAAYDGNWDRISNDDWYKKPCFDQARAAIAAMREPTKGMVEASYGMFRPEEDWLTKREAKDVWQAMIDAALTSTEPQE